MISVVIPVLNNARGLKRTLISLVSERNGHEVLVADAGSIDGTVAVAREMGWARMVRTSGSRAARMNHGADRARGDILLFLEAGTTLERGWAAAVEEAAAQPGFSMGCFELEVTGCDPRLRVLETASRLRTRLLRIARINQALFMKADHVRGAQVFLDAGTLEGADLSRRMRQRGRIVPLPLRSVVPADRWREAGIHTRVVHDAVALHKWYYGEQPSRLVAMGGDQRNAVMMFCDRPDPGNVKKWLSRIIGGERSARVYRTGFLQALATVNRARIDADRYVFFRPRNARADMERWLGDAAMLVAQKGRTDTERRAHAIQTVHAMAPGRILILGPHCPALTTREVRQALHALDHHDLVFGPTDDGGCYLVGVKAPHPEFFGHMSWDPDQMLQEAIAAAGTAGLSYGILKPLMDFDSAEDLNRNWALGYMQD